MTNIDPSRIPKNTGESTDESETKPIEETITIGPASEMTKFIPTDVLEWLSGDKDIPEEIRKLGDDVASKMNWVIVYTILSQYSRIAPLFNFVKFAETKLYDLEELAKEGTVINKKQLMAKYLEANRQLTEVLEFSRKFTVQNKDILTNSGLSEEDRVLLDKIKRLKPDSIRKILTIIDTQEKGE